MGSSWSNRLVFVLRVTAVVTMSAIGAVVMPRSWMSAIHASLGLGALPDGPIVSYLARSTSAFYFMHGALLWLVSTDLKRFDPVLCLLVWLGIPFAIFLLVLDHRIGLPLCWRLGEGPFVLVLMGAILFMQRRARREWAAIAGRETA
jgi:hypothetical protein